MDDPALEQALDRLSELESRISHTRRVVQQVSDQLAAEIARRYQVGEVEAAPVG
jgi:uncharacterized coiled-coil protein SlyX